MRRMIANGVVLHGRVNKLRTLALAAALSASTASVQADTVWMNSTPGPLPCGVVHAWTEDYLGIAPGSNQVYKIEYYHWYPADHGRLQGNSRGGRKAEIDAALAGDDATLKNWIKRTMTAEVVGDYRDGVLLADGEQCPGLGEGGFPEWH